MHGDGKGGSAHGCARVTRGRARSIPTRRSCDLMDELAVTIRFSGAVSTSPTVKATGPRVVSSGVVWSAMAEIVGASLTGVIVRRKLSLAAPPSGSCTVMVRVEVHTAVLE